jgi:hypothetical protein
MLRIENSKLQARVHSGHGGHGAGNLSKSQEKDPNIFSKISYYDQNKENDFKEEMLKLTIFQKNRLDQINHNNVSPNHTTPTPPVSAQPPTASRGQPNINNYSQVNPIQHNQAQAASKMMPFNKKKAEF